MPDDILSTTLLTLAAMVDAVIQGTHALTAGQFAELGAALDECAAMARLLEIDAYNAVTTGRPQRPAALPALVPNVLPFPDARSRLVRAILTHREPSHAQD